MLNVDTRRANHPDFAKGKDTANLRRNFMDRREMGVVNLEEYTFIRAMAGDNVDYTDMDFIAPEDLR